MPRKDINGNDLAPYADFPGNPIVRNIEFAAGKTCFGKVEFPNCFLTDIIVPSVEHFMIHPDDYENQDCHYLDHQCDYHRLERGNRTFDNIIFCNPFEVGFRGRYETKNFLEKAHQLLSDDGTLMVLGNSSNTWSKFENLTKNYNKLKANGELEYDFEFELNTVDQNHPYRVNHRFYLSNLSAEAIPNELIRIKKA